MMFWGKQAGERGWKRGTTFTEKKNSKQKNSIFGLNVKSYK